MRHLFVSVSLWVVFASFESVVCVCVICVCFVCVRRARVCVVYACLVLRRVCVRLVCACVRASYLWRRVFELASCVCIVCLCVRVCVRAVFVCVVFVRAVCVCTVVQLACVRVISEYALVFVCS